MPGLNVDPLWCRCQQLVQGTIRDPGKCREENGLVLGSLAAMVIQEASGPNFEDDIVNSFVQAWVKFVAVGSTTRSFAELERFNQRHQGSDRCF